MPKPFTDAAGNGIHVHSNLNQEGNNLFADSAHAPNELMRHWIGGPLEHASPISSISSFGAPTPNGPRRIQAYTFAPTHVCWGLDNRTVLARCIAEPSSAANRAEFRSAGEDANPYLIIAATLAAGCDGIERKVGPMPMSVGDMYSRPGDATALPASLANILALYQHGALTQMLDNTFSRSFTSIAAAEIALVQTQESAKDEVSDNVGIQRGEFAILNHQRIFT